MPCELYLSRIVITDVLPYYGKKMCCEDMISTILWPRRKRMRIKTRCEQHRVTGGQIEYITAKQNKSPDQTSPADCPTSDLFSIMSSLCVNPVKVEFPIMYTKIHSGGSHTLLPCLSLLQIFYTKAGVSFF